MADTGHSVQAPRLAAWRALLTASSRVVDVLADEMQNETGLPLPWYEVLLHLREHDEGRLRMHELADSLLLSRSAATRFVDRMVEAGLVHRTSCDTDRRGRFIEMTELGRITFAAAAPIHLRGIGEHFARYLSDDEARCLVQILGRVAPDPQRSSER